MAFKPLRTITLPVALGATGVVLSIAMLVGWILVLVRNVQLTQQLRANTWLMASGSLSFLVIVTVIVVISLFLAREILESQRQVRFIDSVTHELKSPLASLKLLVETLDRRTLDERKRHELHRMMLDDVDRLGAFIDDILESSRVGYRRDRTASKVDLRELVQRAADRALDRHHAEREVLSLQVPENLTLYTDGTALEVVLRNLLDNAVKYSGETVSVALMARRVSGKRVLIEVRDQGIGIPRQHLARVFDRFYRAPTESVLTRSGTGLGLYVAAGLVRSLGGRLQAESPGPNRGTLMSFTIPLFLPGSSPPTEPKP